MISVKIFLIISILLSVVLAFFSIMLLTALVTDKQNFLFTKIISNKAKDNIILKSGTGLIAGTSIGLIICLSLFYHNYDCGFENLCNSAESEKPKIYHDYGEVLNRQGEVSMDSKYYGKSIEWINGGLIIFLAAGLSMFSIEFFKLFEDSGFNNNDELMLWIIFGVSLAIILIVSCLLIFVLIVKKPKVESGDGSSISTFSTENNVEYVDDPKRVFDPDYLNDPLPNQTKRDIPIRFQKQEELTKPNKRNLRPGELENYLYKQGLESYQVKQILNNKAERLFWIDQILK
jgi:hypothetical protein